MQTSKNIELAPNSPLVVVAGWTFIDRDEDGLILSGKLQTNCKKWVHLNLSYFYKGTDKGHILW